MNILKSSIVVIYLLIVCVTLAFSQAPERINYQGFLTDDNGNPFNGNANIEFVIFDAPTDGANLWSETKSSVTVEEGLFNVELGVSPAFPTGLFSGASRFLQITANGNLLTPRQKITGVAYAINANVAAVATTVVEDAIIPNMIRDGAVTNTKLFRDAVTNVKIADGAITGNKIAEQAVGSTEILDGSVSAVDIADEPGIANSQASFITPNPVGEYTTFDSITINVPTPGYVHITCGGYVYLNHTTGTGTQIWLNVESIPDYVGLGGGPSIINIPPEYPSTFQDFNSFYNSRVFWVEAGVATFYANLYWYSGAGSLTHGRTNMIATFFPSWYGEFFKKEVNYEQGTLQLTPGN